MNDLSIMPFGKYKGQEMIKVPSDYLLWLFEENKCCVEVRIYIEENMDVIKSDIKK